MTKNLHKGNFNLKTRVSSALLISLGLILLTISCPVKKLFHQNFTNKTAVVKNKQVSTFQRSHAELSVADDCSLVSEKVLFVDSDLSQLIKSQSATSFTSITLSTSLYAYSLLKDSKDHVDDASLNPSSVPIFLQHLRLLI